MNARELRIGNLVYYRMKDELDERKEWLEPNIIDHDDLGVIDENFQPIQLTKEWLLKFGFEQQKWGDFMLTYYRKGNILYSLSDGNVELNEPNICLTQLKHVHQLQNLYFALTGEELTIKS